MVNYTETEFGLVCDSVVYGVGVTLIEPLDHSSFFSREMIYGYPDDFERFSYFCRASLDYIVKCGKQPDILPLLPLFSGMYL